MINDLLERPIVAQLLLIAAAVICGSGIWLVVQLTATEEVTLNINVVAINVPPEAILEVNPAQIPVKFSFPTTESPRMTPNNFAVEVDFSDLKLRLGTELRGTGERVIARDMVRATVDGLSNNITPVDILLPQIRWEAKLRHATAIVEPVVTGEPLAGYVFDPTRAIIDGANEFSVLLTKEAEERFLASGEQRLAVRTQPLDITGRFGVIRQQVNLVLPPGVSLPPFESTRNRILVLEIVEQTTTRRLLNVPIRYEFLTDVEGLRATVTPAQVDVLVTGRLSVVNSITPDMIEFGLFGITERAGSRRELEVEARIADAFFRTVIDEVATDPPTVQVEISAIE